MSELHFLQSPTSISTLCQNQPETLEQFLQCNPRIGDARTTLPSYSLYSRYADRNSSLIAQHLNSLPLAARENLYACVADYGDDVITLAEFHDRNFSNFSLADFGQSANGVVAAGFTTGNTRLNSFQSALREYQNALINLNKHTRVGRVAAGQKAELKRQVTQAYENLNRYYQQEMRRIVPAQHHSKNRGSALSNAERGITLAERHKGKGIHIADMHEGRKVSQFSNTLRYAGRGVLAIDVGFRGAKVNQARANNQDWQRELAVQSGGLIGSVTGGGLAINTALTLSRVALAATPMGWAVLIGSSVVMGAILAYQGDSLMQRWTGSVWDRIFRN